MHLPLADHWLRQWPVTSQQRSRRNAMVAATALTRRRAEAHEVAEYLSAREVAREVRRDDDDVPARPALPL